MGLSCDDARKLLVEAIRGKCIIPDLAQAILLLVAEGESYSDSINGVLNSNGNRWPEQIIQAGKLIRRSTGINIVRDRKENYSDAIRRCRRSKRSKNSRFDTS